jgi:GDP-L-fucose synthase
MMETNSKIFVAGHRGLAGSSILRCLESKGFTNLVVRSSKELDLRNQQAVREFFLQEKPEFVFDAAAKVGGILANSTYPAEFIYDNIMIQSNLIQSSYETGVKKFLFLGSVCIYPKESQLPIRENHLMTGPLETTNEAYAIAKICGIKMCEFYRKQYGFNAVSVMPSNLYGPGDNFHPQNSHVISGLIQKFYSAKLEGRDKIECWGDGSPEREFLYIDDLSSACFEVMQKYDHHEIINISSGVEYTIKEVAEMVKEIVGFQGEIIWDTTKPNGTMKRPLNINKIKKMGWFPKVNLYDGISITFDWYMNKYQQLQSARPTERGV